MGDSPRCMSRIEQPVGAIKSLGRQRIGIQRISATAGAEPRLVGVRDSLEIIDHDDVEQRCCNCLD